VAYGTYLPTMSLRSVGKGVEREGEGTCRAAAPRSVAAHGYR